MLSAGTTVGVRQQSNDLQIHFAGRWIGRYRSHGVNAKCESEISERETAKDSSQTMATDLEFFFELRAEKILRNSLGATEKIKPDEILAAIETLDDKNAIERGLQM
jgi:hypothetical protein